MNGVALTRHLGLDLLQEPLCRSQLVVFEGGETSYEVSVECLVDGAAAFPGYVGYFDGNLAGGEPGCRRIGTLGEDSREGFDKRLLLFSGATTHLECDEIHAAVEHPPVVRQFDVEVVAHHPTLSEVVVGDGFEAGDEVGVLDTVDPAAVVVGHDPAG